MEQLDKNNLNKSFNKKINPKVNNLKLKQFPDLILIHAPSVYDFRKKSIMFGPVSDLVPSTPIFEMYPIGFLTISNYLIKRGLSVRIVNLAYRMYHDPNFDVEVFIKKLNPVSFGIDLHWLPHCQGATEIAKIIKKYHPNIPVIFGGFSSSYFFKELIEFEQVDYIVRGDSAEEPLYQLVKILKEKLLNEELLNRKLLSKKLLNKKIKVYQSQTYQKFDLQSSLKAIPNLVFKNNGLIQVNSIDCVSKDLNEIDFDYSVMFKQVIKFKDIRSIVPFHDWFRYPITTIPVLRGCENTCANCGGSKTAFNIFANRAKPAFRDPKKLVEEIKLIRRYINSPIFLLGDLNSNSREYVEEFFKYAKTLDKKLQIFFEFFEPPQNWFFESAAKTFTKVCYEISPDSHDEKIRNYMGKYYTNEELFACIEFALSKGALRFDLYFMTGLPYQTKESILETVKFCEEFYKRLNWDKRFMPFISPMAPFLDPGSRIFESPKDFGFKLLANTLKDHIKLILKPSWKYILNYESNFISKDDLVDVTYKAALGLNELKAKAGSISEQVMFQNENRIKTALKIMSEIDKLINLKDNDIVNEKLSQLKDIAYKYSLSTVCEKRELDFPLFDKNFNWFNIIKDVVKDAIKNIILKI